MRMYDLSNLPPASRQLAERCPDVFKELPGSILSIGNDAKSSKSTQFGWLTGIHFGAPADSSGVQHCVGSKAAQCEPACLAYQGRKEHMLKNRAYVLRRTLLLDQHREIFLSMLGKDLAKLKKKSYKLQLSPCVRMNGTTDDDWSDLARQHPDLQFYDYTKHLRKWMLDGSCPKNYDLTFSYSPAHHFRKQVAKALEAGMRIAAVFQRELPDEFLGRQVIDGDVHDLFFLHPKNVIIGLLAKGTAKKGGGLVIEQ